MCFASASDALSFWESAYRGLLAISSDTPKFAGGIDDWGTVAVDQADAKLLQLSSEGHLRAFVISEFYCLCEFVLLNIGGPGELMGFQLSFKDGKVITWRVGDLLADRWLRFYEAVTGRVGTLEPRPTRYTWKEARSSVLELHNES